MEEGTGELNYFVAGIDVHKKMLAVVIADVAGADEYRFERRMFGAAPADLRSLVEWLVEHRVREAVMESTAQYWKPVWQALEGHVRPFLAQAWSNRAPRGRKRDFADAERLVKRHVADELVLSYVPDPEQRLWRAMTRARHQLTRDRVRLHNQLEAFLEDVRIKLSSCLSDLLGMSGRDMLEALAEGEKDPAAIAALAQPEVKATPEELRDALSAAPLNELQRKILRLSLDRLKLIESQIEDLDRTITGATREYGDAVRRLGEVPGFGANSAQQVIAEVGPKAAVFPSPQQLSSWVGTCPGREESAQVSRSNRSPKGNRQMRNVLNQAANAAVRAKGSVFEVHYRRLVPRLGHCKAIWAIANRLCRLVWKILHQGATYEERGAHRNPKAIQQRTMRLLRELRGYGYQVQLIPTQTEVAS
jgi:transposase